MTSVSTHKRKFWAKELLSDNSEWLVGKLFSFSITLDCHFTARSIFLQPPVSGLSARCGTQGVYMSLQNTVHSSTLCIQQFTVVYMILQQCLQFFMNLQQFTRAYNSLQQFYNRCTQSLQYCLQEFTWCYNSLHCVYHSLQDFATIYESCRTQLTRVHTSLHQFTIC